MRVILYSALSTDQCLERLFHGMKEKRLIWTPGYYQADDYSGEVKGNRFRIAKVVSQVKSYRPEFRGTVISQSGATVIGGKFYFYWFTILFSIFWFGGIFFFGGLLLLVTIIQPPYDLSMILVGSSLVVFGIVTFILVRRWIRAEERVIIGYLETILVASPKDSRQMVDLHQQD